MLKKLTAIACMIIAFNAFADDQPAPGQDKMPPPKPVKPFVYQAKPTDVVYGKEDAPVTIVEYASLSCPHCAHFFTHVLPELAAKYIDTGKVRLVYRDFPLNEPALKAAALVQCADKDRRHVFIKVLFSTQEKWAYGTTSLQETLAGIAQLGGIARDRFDACMADKELQKTILEVEKEAGDDYGITSTPSFFINGIFNKKDHELDTMSKAIEAAMAQGQKK